MAAHRWIAPASLEQAEMAPVSAKVNAVVIRDSRVTIQEIVGEVGISTFSVHSILTEDLARKRMTTKFTTMLQHIPHT